MKPIKIQIKPMNTYMKLIEIHRRPITIYVCMCMKSEDLNKINKGPHETYEHLYETYKKYTKTNNSPYDINNPE